MELTKQVREAFEKKLRELESGDQLKTDTVLAALDAVEVEERQRSEEAFQRQVGQMKKRSTDWVR